MSLSQQEIETLFRLRESDRVEWKPSFAQKESIGKAVCAFANDFPNHQQPGVLFIGVEDDRRCSNLPITDHLERDVIDYLRNTITPPPKLDVRPVEIDGCHVLAVIVEPHLMPPVLFKGDIYIRVGPTSRKTSREEEGRLMDRRVYRFFDVMLIIEAAKDDLDVNYLENEYIPFAVSQEALIANARPLEHRMAALRLTDQQGTPTVLGLFVGGKDPRYFLPNTYVQFRRVDGLEVVDPNRDELEISGQLHDIIIRINDKLIAHNAISRDMASEFVSVAHPTYPLIALRELIYNAIVHRDYQYSNAPIRITWYDDRIEIWNPGGPFGHVTEDNFGAGDVTDYRNPHIAEAMKNLGYVERAGQGIPRSRDELRKNGNAAPLFEVRSTENYVLVTVRVRA
ncbi:MAG: ATP-binding protein [Chloroflexota bacterium]|nr:ATP-binding protein [Chloroflexota bacterium]